MALKSRLRILVPPTIELGCEAKAFVEYGPPAQKILELANELAVDLIVLGVRQPPRSPFDQGIVWTRPLQEEWYRAISGK
jgi:nucleotide-binding universal stress UspA family protein